MILHLRVALLSLCVMGILGNREFATPSLHELSLGASRLRDRPGYGFKLWVPHANGVEIHLKGSKAKDVKSVVTLTRGEENGRPIWYGASPEAKTGDQYQVAIESSWNDCFDQEGAILYRRDPYNRYSPPEAFHENWCELTDRGENFAWSQKENPWLIQEGLGKHSIYELHFGTFTPEGTFTAAIEKLEYISWLGFTAIEVLPVTEYGGSWGYNPRSCLAIHSKYGTPDDFRRFVDKAHSLGIAIIVDICLNHGSAKFNALWNWDGYSANGAGGIYFDLGSDDTPWGRKFAFERPEVQDYLMDACRMYLGNEYRCDGLRFDSTHNMPDWLVSKMNWELKSEFSKACLIAETVPEDPRALKERDLGFDAIFLHAPHFDVVDCFIHKEDDGMPKLAGAIRQKYFPRSGSDCAINALLGTHDQVGCRKNGGRDADGRLHRYFVDRMGGPDNWHARAKTRMWWAASTCGVLSGVPMLFQGTETLQPAWWHLDRPMQWDLDHPNAQQMMALVRATHELRKEFPWLGLNAPTIVHRDDKNKVFGVKRGDEYLAVLHAGEEQWEGDARYGIPVGSTTGTQARQLFNSQAEEFGGWEASWTEKKGELAIPVVNGRLPISLPKWSVLVFQFAE